MTRVPPATLDRVRPRAGQTVLADGSCGCRGAVGAARELPGRVCGAATAFSAPDRKLAHKCPS